MHIFVFLKNISSLYGKMWIKYKDEIFFNDIQRAQEYYHLECYVYGS